MLEEILYDTQRMLPRAYLGFEPLEGLHQLFCDPSSISSIVFRKLCGAYNLVVYKLLEYWNDIPGR